MINLHSLMLFSWHPKPKVSAHNSAHRSKFLIVPLDFAKDITPQSLVELLKLKTNLIVPLSTKQTPLSLLAPEFSLILPPPGTPLISYFPKRNEPPSLIPIVPTNQDATDILEETLKEPRPIWFSGVPQALGSNPQLVPILHAPPESFASEIDGGSADAIVDSAEKGGEGLWAGSQLSVVTGFQTHDGARITWVGGVDIFSDELAQKVDANGVKSANAAFARDIVAWTFQESLVLRIDKVEHRRVNTTGPSELYTTNDELVFDAYISKFNPKQGVWEPYSGINDLQLEFTMLDPHIRTALPPVRGVPGKYSVTFRAPDRHGVFKFIIDYKRKGYVGMLNFPLASVADPLPFLAHSWTHLHSSVTVPIVPPRHDGYARFLSVAWPYYAGAISTSVAFFLFSAIWLAGEVRESSRRPGKAGKTE
jgi:oligosaccharyltransferase complex subunit beta